MIRANLWKILTVLGAVIVALGSHMDMFPWLPIWAQRTIELLSFVVAIVSSVLINLNAGQMPNLTVTDATRAKLPVLVLCVLGASLLSGCATLRAKDHVFRNPDGSLNVPKILAYAEDGIQADCRIGTTTIAQDICTFGLPGVQAAEAFVAQNPTAGAASIAQLLTTLEAKVPHLSPYLDFAIALLNGVNQ